MHSIAEEERTRRLAPQQEHIVATAESRRSTMTTTSSSNGGDSSSEDATDFSYAEDTSRSWYPLGGSRGQLQDEALDTQTPASKQNQDQQQDEGAALNASKENRHVFYSRLLVLTVLVVSSLGVSLAVFYYLSSAENQQFVKQYEADTLKLKEAVGTSLSHSLGSSDAFAVKMVSYARYSNSTWPFVAMPDFYIQASKLLRLSGAFRVGVALLVRDSEKVEWETYASENRDWLNTSIELQVDDPDYHGPIIREYPMLDYVHTWKGQPVSNASWCFPNDLNGGDASHPDEPSCYHSVSWQHAPVATTRGSPYGKDLYGIPQLTETMMHAYQTRTAAITAYGNLWDSNTDDPKLKQMIIQAEEGLKLYFPPEEDPMEPNSYFIYPILPVMDAVRVRVDASNSTDQPPVAGLLSFALRWVELLRDVLPSTSEGLIVVFHQAHCGPSFTYQLNGPVAVYLGINDLHDPRFDYLAQSADLADLMDSAKSAKSSTKYTGLPLSHDFCAKTFTIYPSATMESNFKTNSPAVTAVASALIFLFTSAVFVLYDVLVARRQRLVLNRAITSGRIVSSLFPESVKQKLYEEHEEELRVRANQSKFLSSSTVKTEKSVLTASVHSSGDPSSSGDQLARFARPIADHYPATTVLLADIAGFTQWSAHRSPTEVFELLETLYAAFDSIAAKRQVLKIETIGDCYVACTGLPQPQKDHAVRLVRFANSCIHEMSRITTSLADRLGADTESLALRVGLCSGPITAGILRGDKARFQLFGDTINTASRMESNGAAGQIHVSASTANELSDHGKGHWLVPREDLVYAKGKGEMRTFWVIVCGDNCSSIGGSSMGRTTARSAAALSLKSANSNVDEHSERPFAAEDTRSAAAGEVSAAEEKCQKVTETRSLDELEKQLHGRLQPGA